MIAVLIGTTLAVLAISGLSLIDFIKGYMAMNWLFIIPVGGLAVGAGVGAIQGYTCFIMNSPLKKHLILVACLSAALVYFSADVARYYTEEIDITPAITTQIPPGRYPVSKLIPFFAYLKLTLSNSSYTLGSSNTSIMELGERTTRGYYVANLAGAILGAWGFLLWFISRYPLCQQCDKYLRGLHEISRYFITKETITEFIGHIMAAVEKGDVSGLQTLYLNSNNGFDSKDMVFKSTLEARGCKSCGNAVLVTTASVKKNGWEAIDDLKATLPTQTANIFFGAKGTGKT